MDKKKLISDQFLELAKEYDGLMLRFENDKSIIEGDFHFIATYQNYTIEDTYTIKIIIPPDYPEELPLVKELSNRIPSTFHMNYGGFLCLEVDTKIKMEFLENPTLLYFVQRFVLSYLYGYSYFEKHERLPFGERPHGAEGVLDFYKEYFDVTSDLEAARLLFQVVCKPYRGHHYCNCGSGKRLRHCHGPKIIGLKSMHLEKNFEADLKEVIYILKKKGIIK